MRTSTQLTPVQVVEILDLLKQRIPHRIIAERYHIAKKTVSRISTGETWKDVSLRYNAQAPVNPIQLPVSVTGVDPGLCDLLDELAAIKNHFAFNFNQPLYWGWFDSWDGLHSVTSDGYIIWESSDLVTYAQKLAATGIDAPPVYASMCEELPTFELEEIMTNPVGEAYCIDAIAGDVVRLVGPAKSLYIRQRYVNIANRLKLDIRPAGDREDYVYLTKNKPKSPKDPLPIVIACVVTFKEATD